MNLTTFLLLLTSGSGSPPIPTNPLGVTYFRGPVAESPGLVDPRRTTAVAAPGQPAPPGGN
jgi:hypothetical protein